MARVCFQYCIRSGQKRHGQVLMAISDGGLQFLVAASRANVGVKSGRRIRGCDSSALRCAVFRSFWEGQVCSKGKNRKAHRCPSWLVCLKNRGPWFTWWLNHLPGPSIFQKGHLWALLECLFNNEQEMDCQGQLRKMPISQFPAAFLFLVEVLSHWASLHSCIMWFNTSLPTVTLAHSHRKGPPLMILWCRCFRSQMRNAFHL